MKLDLAVVVEAERGGEQRLEPDRAVGRLGEGLALALGAGGSWADTITSISPLATPSTMARRSSSERSGGFILKKVR